MNTKRLEAMQDYINKAFESIQRLNIQASEGNANAIIGALNGLRIVYNTLDAMKQEQTEGQPVEEETNGQVSDAE